MFRASLGRQICRYRPHRNRASRQPHQLKTILLQLRHEIVKHGRLRGRQIERLRHEQLLRVAASLRFQSPVLIEKYSLVSDVLIDQQQAFIVSRDDETLIELAQRADVRRERFGSDLSCNLLC